ncbi:MAG: alkaline phosphatase D family protein [Cyanophyceae cyanobacterium]
MRRRNVLLGAAALTGFALTPLQSCRRSTSHPQFADYPFSLGVASGEPRPHSVVLWTRLAPNPLEPVSVPSVDIPVRWQMAADERMSQVVAKGEAIASPQFAHSVHVLAEGLEPQRWYWYQFKVGNELSPIGRTRTAPAANAAVERLAFAFANCQNWQAGYYPAHRHLAQEDLDFVVFLGDYIYEGGPQGDAPRQHNGSECVSLADYRRRYALYKSDPDLQAAHAAFPWIVTWDDHEVDSNYANFHPEDQQSRQEFLRRRANAYQAYYEHMPLRPVSDSFAELRLYRRFSFGNLAQLNVLDTRQYRTDQPCGDGPKPRCPEAFAPTATMMGAEQERWLMQGIAESPAQWNAIAQQTMMAQFAFEILSGESAFNLDQWDGYVAERDRLLKFFAQQPARPIVITGDIHSSWVNQLKADFNNPRSAIVATEFVSPSVSSLFPAEYVPIVRAFLENNSHIKFFDGGFHGYVRAHLDRQRWQSDYRVVTSILDPDAAMQTLVSFVVEDGQPEVQQL